MFLQQTSQNYNWEYTSHPQYSTLLEKQYYDLLKQLWNQSIDIKKSLIDTRGVHKHLFKDLTPLGHEYFAGNYRGETYPLLLNYEVVVPGNPKVGYPTYPAKNIPTVMFQFGNAVERELTRLDDLHKSDSPLYQKLIQTVNFACAAFVKLTKIHPYANGNGHMGRFVLISTLTKYGYSPKNWEIHPRPLDPPYTSLIRQYEDGDKEPLLQHILEQIPIP